MVGALPCVSAYVLCKYLAGKELAVASPLGSCVRKLYGLMAKAEHCMHDTTASIGRAVMATDGDSGGIILKLEKEELQDWAGPLLGQ